jgi:hypothetical protein
MDCREFRDNHVAFVDDVLSAIETRAMQDHRDVCQRCARKDAAVRRGLLLIRSLPSVEPSPDFMIRLEARLRNVRSDAAYVGGGASFGVVQTFLAVAAGIAIVSYLSFDSARRTRPTEFRMQPVVASIPELPPSPLANSAFVASVPTGMPLWPAIYLAGQAPMRLAALEMGPE